MRTSKSDIVFVFAPAFGNIGKFSNHLGTAYLRASLLKNGISTVQYLNDHPLTINSISNDIINQNPRIVGFTVYDANFALTQAIAKSIKSQRSKILIVFGGPTATFGAEIIMKIHKYVDVCVMGEAEETGTKIFSRLLENRNLDENIEGIAYRENGHIIRTKLPSLVGSHCTDYRCSLDTIPSPYLSEVLKDGRTGVLTGRGCTHQCQYCVFAELGQRKLRLHSINRVINELEYIANQQNLSRDRYVIAIHDDTFTLIPSRAKELCQAIINKNLGLTFSCITRADAIDDELLKLMREAGFISIAFGLESAVPSVLRETGKVRNPNSIDPDLSPEKNFIEQVKYGVTKAKELGFSVGISIILGLPNESEINGLATLQFVKKLPIDFYMHNFLWVFPGTPLWQTHKRYGIECSLDSMGLANTYKYKYNVTKLRPRPKCSLEQDAESIREIVFDSLYSCTSYDSSDSNVRGIANVILIKVNPTKKISSWLKQVLNIGGNVIQIYTPIKHQERTKLIQDRCNLIEDLIPIRHHIQIIPKSRDNEGNLKYLIACSGVDLYKRHKPELVSFSVSNTYKPILEWLIQDIKTAHFCDVTKYLLNPEGLISNFGLQRSDSLSQLLKNKPIPPKIKYIERWLQGSTPCTALSRIEIYPDNKIRCCPNCDPIGNVGSSFEEIKFKLDFLVNEVTIRRGCNHCPNTYCPRCPFPGVDDITYCKIMTKQTLILKLLQSIHIYSRIPIIFNNQRDKVSA